MSLLDQRPSTTQVGKEADTVRWVAICHLDDLQVGRGMVALVAGRPVALFRTTTDGPVHAIDNVDPWTGASVLGRGLVGHTVVEGRPIDHVASPLRKQRFDLRTGRCLDGPRSVGVWPTRVVDGIVEMTGRSSSGGNDPETAP